jgi:hypothetical protein
MRYQWTTMLSTDGHVLWLMVAVCATFHGALFLYLQVAYQLNFELTLYTLTRMSKKAPGHKSGGHPNIVRTTLLTSNLPWTNFADTDKPHQQAILLLMSRLFLVPPTLQIRGLTYRPLIMPGGVESLWKWCLISNPWGAYLWIWLDNLLMRPLIVPRRSSTYHQ